MPQQLPAHELEKAQMMGDETVPALQNTEYYFALVSHQNRKVLCILDGDKWRVTNYQEMMSLM